MVIFEGPLMNPAGLVELVSPTLRIMSSFLIVGAAKNQVAMNPRNTVVFDAKRLIVRKFQDSMVHNDRTH
ncbi:hsp70-like protein [Colletotrichum tamarilloi]|uniref:Hsp70-like protein n=1 Tax=Colletotrichum tamarilloi TaxID=1209934 RepID=A0ABQ9RN89_9PEZI|nr:hsp70-like protein [Colletotrichum tamarilloi]KAK1508466.1 hsp70-like protein [Colletotrichum tamarilloi]